MIWGTLKLGICLSLACLIGLLLSTVPVGGKPLSARILGLWARPEVKRVAGEVSSRVRRSVEAASSADDALGTAAHRAAGAQASATPGLSAGKPQAKDAEAAPVVAEARPADDYRPSERQAVAKLIAQKSHRTSRAP